MKTVLLILLTLCTVEISLRVKDSNNFNFQLNFNTTDSFKVLFLGDSILSTIPERLADRLQKYSSRKFEVKKIAIPSAKIANMYRNLDQYITDYNPNLIISLLGKSDIQKAQVDKNKDASFGLDIKVIKVILHYFSEYTESLSMIMNSLFKNQDDEFLKLTKQAEVFFQDEKFSLATPLLQKAVKIQNDDISTYLALAYSLQKQTKFQEALNWTKVADDLDANHPSVIARFISIYLDSSMKKEHLKYIKKLQSSKVDDFHVSSALGNYFLKYKDYQQAESYFKSALKADDTKSITYLNLGRSLIHQNKKREALKSLMNAVRKGVTNNENHLTLILHGLEMGFPAEINKFYSEELLVKYPKEKKLYTPIARVSIDLEDYKRSLHYLELAFKFDPNDEGTQKTADLLATKNPVFKKVISTFRGIEVLNYSEVLIQTYPLFANKILSKKIGLFILQYPEKEINSIKSLPFKNKHKITFINSKDIFDNYIGDSDLFQDDKAHLTHKGSDLIAKKIEALISNIKP
jgi:tetratricopeptide (TPR) repeat protein